MALFDPTRKLADPTGRSGDKTLNGGGGGPSSGGWPPGNLNPYIFRTPWGTSLINKMQSMGWGFQGKQGNDFFFSYPQNWPGFGNTGGGGNAGDSSIPGWISGDYSAGKPDNTGKGGNTWLGRGDNTNRGDNTRMNTFGSMNNALMPQQQSPW